MVNLYELLNIPENANRVMIERAIRLARDRQDVDERHLQLARNYLLDETRRKEYNKRLGIKVTPREKSHLSVGTDWRYVGGGVALVLVLFIPLVYVMLGQQKATEKLYQQKDSEYQQAQEAMEKAWGVSPSQNQELQHEAIEKQLQDMTQAHEKQLQQAQ